MFKFVVLAAVVAVANAGLIGAPASVVAHGYTGPSYGGPVAAPAYGYSGALRAAPLAYAAPAYAKVAAPLAYAAPVVKAIDTDFDPNPSYSYGYDIQDALTGDVKSQKESRQGDVVQGQYSLIEADGTRRVVDYTADPVNGFNAVVSKQPLVQKVAVAAPVVAKYAAPLAYGAPAYARAAYAAPLAYGAPAYARAAYAAPLGYAAPAYASAAYAAPLAYGAPAYARAAYAAPLGYAAPSYGKAYLG